MTNLRIAQIIAGLSVLVGVMVIIGWYLDITILTSILPQWIRMKFATALCFIFSGIIVYFLTLDKERLVNLRIAILTIFPTLTILVMGTLFLGSIFGFQTGMENIAFIDVHEINTPIFQGRPSVATMVSFILISLIGFIFNFDEPKRRTFSIIGTTVGTIGFVGIVGYIVNNPYLYYEIPKFSNAIAIHTTILFTLLGIAIFLIGQEKEEYYEDEELN